jgi:hypothetical protein
MCGCGCGRVRVCACVLTTACVVQTNFDSSSWDQPDSDFIDGGFTFARIDRRSTKARRRLALLRAQLTASAAVRASTAARPSTPTPSAGAELELGELTAEELQRLEQFEEEAEAEERAAAQAAEEEEDEEDEHPQSKCWVRYYDFFARSDHTFGRCKWRETPKAVAMRMKHFNEGVGWDENRDGLLVWPPLINRTSVAPTAFYGQWKWGDVVHSVCCKRY